MFIPPPIDDSNELFLMWFKYPPDTVLLHPPLIRLPSPPAIVPCVLSHIQWLFPPPIKPLVLAAVIVFPLPPAITAQLLAAVLVFPPKTTAAVPDAVPLPTDCLLSVPEPVVYTKNFAFAVFKAWDAVKA